MYEFCLPTRGIQVPAGPEWYHEIKFDGFRLLVHRTGERVRLFTRGGYDWTKRYPWIVQAALKNRHKEFIRRVGLRALPLSSAQAWPELELVHHLPVTKNMDEKTALLEQAARCRRAAKSNSGHEAATRLIEQAKEYEGRAATLTSANILVRRDQFNITPQGIIHKPTDAAFTPHPGDPHSGEMRNGRLGNALPSLASYNPEEVRRIMRELWTEYVTRNFCLF